MHPAIQEITEFTRGCGSRKTGGLYLVASGRAETCGKLPIPFAVCPCCGEGIKPSRAPKWLEQPEKLWRELKCKKATFSQGCTMCPLSNAYETGPALLIWVGTEHYKTTEDFMLESQSQGVSRRIPWVPKEFVVGETWCLLAHEKAIDNVANGKLGATKKDQYTAGIFSIFKPHAIEIVVTGDESDEEIEGYLKRGLTPVKVTTVKRNEE